MISQPKPSIMVAGDEPLILKVLSRMIENLGFGVPGVYSSGDAALVAHRGGSLSGPDSAPDLILLNLQMPDMDGVEFVRHLVERNDTGTLVLISGEDERMLADDTRFLATKAS